MVVTDRALCGGADGLVATVEAAVSGGGGAVHAPAQGLPRAPRAPPAGPARRAVAGGTDYLIAGPIFQTRSHPGAEPAGVALIEEIAGAVRVPGFAIGGGAGGGGGG